MLQRHWKILLLSLSAAPWLMAGHVAYAQIGNQPFSFSNGGRGSGMSVGGREAIINEKVQGIRPDNLVRGPGGELLDVQKGPGGSALTSYAGTGQTIPQYRGTSFRSGNPEMAAGIFNGFFMPTIYSSSYPFFSPMRSGATVNTWTSRVTSGGMAVSYLDGNIVDSWTGQVLIMDLVY